MRPHLATARDAIKANCVNAQAAMKQRLNRHGTTVARDINETAQPREPFRAKVFSIFRKNERQDTEGVESVEPSVEQLKQYVPGNWIDTLTTPTNEKWRQDVAATVSHLKALHRFYRSGEPVGIIVEGLTCTDNTDRMHDAPLGWEIVMGGPSSGSPSTGSPSTGFHFRRSNEFLPRGQLWYVVTRQYALYVLQRYGCIVDDPVFGCRLNGVVSQMRPETTIIGTGSHRYSFGG